MEQITYFGHKFTTDGERVWVDGELQDIRVPEKVKLIKKVDALLVDDVLYYNEEIYCKK